MGLIFSTGSYKNKVAKSAKVTTNDTTQTNLSISFSANIYSLPDTVSSLRLAPAKLDIDQTTKKQILLVENHGKEKVKLSLAETPHTEMRIKIKDDEIKPGKQGRIQFEWKGDFPKQDLKQTITFETSDTTMKHFGVPYVVKGTEPAQQPQPKPQVTQPTPQPPPPAPGTAQKPTPQIIPAPPPSPPPHSSTEKPFGDQITQGLPKTQGANAESTIVVTPQKP